MTDLERFGWVKELLLSWMQTRPGGVYQSSIQATEFQRLVKMLTFNVQEACAVGRREGEEQASGEIRTLRKALHDETMKRLASAAEMRERALEAARDGVRVAFGERRDQEFIDQNDVIGSIEDAFASALPLTPEEPA